MENRNNSYLIKKIAYGGLIVVTVGLVVVVGLGINPKNTQLNK